jgi:site-specific DNA recombinase
MTFTRSEADAGRSAVIYCRVSNSKQKTEHDGLRSQETRCREYARYRECKIVKVFDDDISGGKVSRPGMDALLVFLKSRRRDTPFVIIDDLSRLARGIQAHWQLRELILSAGGELISPSIEFGTDSDSKLVENMRAVVAQHHLEKNKEQTRHRMEARIKNGYWTFWAPRGYKFKRSKGNGGVLVRDEPIASIVAEGLEGFASGRFETQVELKRFFESKPEFPKDLPSGKIRNQRIKDMLTQPLYAGYVGLPSWGISLRKAQHKGLISFASYEKIQTRLTQKARAPVKKNLNQDFPLRAFILCGECKHPMTSCWSTSSTGKKHPYYQCYNRDCTAKPKSVQRDVVERDFEALVRTLVPSKGLVAIARKMFKTIWDHRINQLANTAEALQAQADGLDKQITSYLDRILDASNTTVIKAYEQRINALEAEKAILREKAAQDSKQPKPFEDAFRTPMAFLSSPWKLWASGELKQRRMLMKMAFSSQPEYVRGKGFRTPDLALPFKALGDVCMGKCEMAHRGRFELPTPRFVVWCSIQLSYRCLPCGAVCQPREGAETSRANL